MPASLTIDCGVVTYWNGEDDNDLGRNRLEEHRALRCERAARIRAREDLAEQLKVAQ